jgi:hypothetical protein
MVSRADSPLTIKRYNETSTVPLQSLQVLNGIASCCLHLMRYRCKVHYNFSVYLCLLGVQVEREIMYQYRPPQSDRQVWAVLALTISALILSLVLCVAIVRTVTSVSSQDANVATIIPTATPTQQAVQLVATATPTAAPTVKPTATHAPTPRPTQSPQSQPTPTPKPCQDPCNPWGYNFSPGNYIYSPNTNFCAYFACINNFWNGAGYVNECHDGMYSKSGGRSGDCSYHGGEWRPLYSH